MYILTIVLIIIVSILLVLIVLVQNSKGGGLASNFQSSTQVAGVRKTADFLEKTTWGLAAALLVLAVMGSAFIPRGETEGDRSMVQEQIQNVAEPGQIPNFPISVPEDSATPADSTN